jgi:hypothetical protein
MTKGLRPIRSLYLPEYNFANPAAASAQPSINPNARGAAPITPVNNIGSKGYNKSLAAS